VCDCPRVTSSPEHLFVGQHEKWPRPTQLYTRSGSLRTTAPCRECRVRLLFFLPGITEPVGFPVEADRAGGGGGGGRGGGRGGVWCAGAWLGGWCRKSMLASGR
jgi:hypothetical protein